MGTEKPSVFQVIQSVIAAMFGVQSARNRQRDFTAGEARYYIIGGIIFVILFILILFIIVNLVLAKT